MSKPDRIRTDGILIALVVAAAFVSACGSPEPSREEPVTAQRPVAEVIRDRAPRWLELDGVQGIYEGRTADGAVCLKVMVIELTDELRASLPDTVEGYPVLLHPTGPIGPVGDS